MEKRMRKLAIAAILFATGCFLSGALKAQAPNTLTKEEIAAGWRLLFDGATLKGWEPREAATWGVADGAIFCAADSAGWLATVDTFADFNLKVEFRAGAEINSGVFLRSQKEGAPATTGYEVQIWDARPTYKTGALVNYVETTTSAKILAGQWNSFDVTADGDHFVVVLNGQKLLDGRDSKHASGVLGLQYNINTGKIEFRNIKIRLIKH
jgi:hypothetical protein